MRTNLKCSNLLIFLFVLAIVNISVYTQLVNSFNKDSDFITLSNILKSSKAELPKRRHNHHYSKINSNILTDHEKLIIEKKIKENLMERLKSLHASSMTLR